MNKRQKDFCKAVVRDVMHTYRQYDKTHIATYAERTLCRHSILDVIDNLDHIGVPVYDRVKMWEYIESMLDRLMRAS